MIIVQVLFLHQRAEDATIPDRVENGRSGCSLLVAICGQAFAWPPQSSLACLCFLFPLIEPDRRSYRIRLSERTHNCAHRRLEEKLYPAREVLTNHNRFP